MPHLRIGGKLGGGQRGRGECPIEVKDGQAGAEEPDWEKNHRKKLRRGRSLKTDLELTLA